MVELEHRLEAEKPQVVFLTETWLTQDRTCKIKGYTVVARRDRTVYRGRVVPQEGGRVARVVPPEGGGVAILLRDGEGLTFRQLPVVSARDENHAFAEITEVVRGVVYVGGSSLNVANVYSPPVQSHFGGGGVVTDDPDEWPGLLNQQAQVPLGEDSRIQTYQAINVLDSCLQ